MTVIRFDDRIEEGTVPFEYQNFQYSHKTRKYVTADNVPVAFCFTKSNENDKTCFSGFLVGF